MSQENVNNMYVININRKKEKTTQPKPPRASADAPRDRHNQDLIDRMKQGEPLYRFDSTSSWFPPRPVIKKDKKALKRLYGDDAE